MQRLAKGRVALRQIEALFLITTHYERANLVRPFPPDVSSPCINCPAVVVEAICVAVKRFHWGKNFGAELLQCPLRAEAV